MTRSKQALLWLLAAVALVVASFVVNAEDERKRAPVDCTSKAGLCTLDECDLMGLVLFADRLMQENKHLKAACGVRGT